MSQDYDEIEVDRSYQDRETKSEGDGDGEERDLQPSGSPTLDKRLNPNAPEFVPGLTASILANKILDELPPYRSWSHAASPENLSYGVPYDYIWCENTIQMRHMRSPFNSQIATRSMSLNVEAKPYVPKSNEVQHQLNDIHDIVGDVEQLPQQQQQKQQLQQIQSESMALDQNQVSKMDHNVFKPEQLPQQQQQKQQLQQIQSESMALDQNQVSRTDHNVLESDLEEHYRCCGCRMS